MYLIKITFIRASLFKLGHIRRVETKK